MFPELFSFRSEFRQASHRQDSRVISACSPSREKAKRIKLQSHNVEHAFFRRWKCAKQETGIWRRKSRERERERDEELGWRCARCALVFLSLQQLVASCSRCWRHVLVPIDGSAVPQSGECNAKILHWLIGLWQPDRREEGIVSRGRRKKKGDGKGREETEER